MREKSQPPSRVQDRRTNYKVSKADLKRWTSQSWVWPFTIEHFWSLVVPGSWNEPSKVRHQNSYPRLRQIHLHHYSRATHFDWKAVDLSPLWMSVWVLNIWPRFACRYFDWPVSRAKQSLTRTVINSKVTADQVMAFCTGFSIFKARRPLSKLYAMVPFLVQA